MPGTPPAVPPLRLNRAWKWVAAAQQGEFRVGGPPPPLHLAPVDTLEVFHAGQWLPVPVVEQPKPEHPAAAREREQAARQARATAAWLAEHGPALREAFKRSEETGEPVPLSALP